MENEYKNGIIYKIIGGDEIYIGSTYLTKEERFKNHKQGYGCWLNDKYHFVSSFTLFEKYGIKNCSIDIIEPFPCETEQQLREREGFHQRNEICVNIRIEGRTKEEIKKYQEHYRQDHKEEIKDYKKQYQEEHKEQISEKHKEYYEEHKEQISEKHKEYYEEHKEQIKEHNKEYREKNKDKIREQKNQSFTCECGVKYTQSNKSRHNKTKQHLAYLEK
jgi:hypothetical protein